MNVLDGVPEPHRAVLVEVLEQWAPALLAALRAKAEPTPQEWEAVLDIMDDAASEHWIPDRYYEMDERGLAIEYAQGAFNNAFMYVNERER